MKFIIATLLICCSAFASDQECDLQLNINDASYTDANRVQVEKILLSKGYKNISPDNSKALTRIEFFPSEITINDVAFPALGRHYFVRASETSRFNWDSTGSTRITGFRGKMKAFKRLLEGIPECQ